MKRLKYLGFSMLLSVIVISFSGCLGNDSIQIGPNKFTATECCRSNAYLEAKYRCRNFGGVMQPLSERNMGGDFILDFACVNPNHTSYGKAYEVGADVSIKVDKKVEYK